MAHSHSSSADVNAPLPKQAGLQLRLPAVNNAARRFNFAPSSPPSPSSRQHPRRFHQAPWASHAAGSASHDQRGIPRMRIVSQPSASHSHHGCIPVPDSRGIALPCSALSRPPKRQQCKQGQAIPRRLRRLAQSALSLRDAAHRDAGRWTSGPASLPSFKTTQIVRQGSRRHRGLTPPIRPWTWGSGNQRQTRAVATSRRSVSMEHGLVARFEAPMWKSS